MAAVMMAGDEKNNPVFHDFLGMSCASGGGGERVVEAAENSVSVASMGASSGGCGLVSGSSDLGSGRKRCNSDSAFMGRDKRHTVVSGSPEYAHLRKMLGKEVQIEQPRRPYDAEMMFAMQPVQRPASSSLILQPPISRRPDLVISKWEPSILMNVGQVAHHSSHLSQGGTVVDKFSPCTYKDSIAGAVVTSQAAADEGSRTGITGGGILKVIASGNTAVERNSTGMLGSTNKQTINSCPAEQESSDMPSRRGMAKASRQMTIFYDGQAHVFDDVHPNKSIERSLHPADIIMALAGSNGGSWSTTYGNSMSQLPNHEAKAPSGDNKVGLGNLSFSHNMNAVQSSQAPARGDVLSFITGVQRSGRNVADARPMVLTEPNSEGKRKLL